MRSALASALARPEWWAIALAAFLLRGGILLLLLPIVDLPTEADLVTSLGPPLEGLILGRPSLEATLITLALASIAAGALVAAWLAASWLDLALEREAADDEELELRWHPRRPSASRELAIRLVAHLPTVVALGWALVRVVGAIYDELLAPGDAAVPAALRILLRAPDAAVLLVAAWLVGEAAGGLAARRITAGEPAFAALRGAFRHVLGRRGLVTLAVTTLVMAAITAPFLLAAGTAWRHLREYLLGGQETVFLASALVLFVAVWVLGLAVLGAALAWRATAWSVAMVPREGPSRDAALPAPEAAPG